MHQKSITRASILTVYESPFMPPPSQTYRSSLLMATSVLMLPLDSHTPVCRFIATKSYGSYFRIDSSVIIATRAELLPPPCLPVPEGQAMEISISSTTYLPHADRRDWEYTGTESTIQLCELAITRFERGEAGWGMDLSTDLPSLIPYRSTNQSSFFYSACCGRSDLLPAICTAISG